MCVGLPLPRVRIPPSPPLNLTIKKRIRNLRDRKEYLTLAGVFILLGTVACSMGTDKSTPLPEKPFNKLSNIEGSGTKLGEHPEVNEVKIIHRKILVPSKVEEKWKAVKIMVRSKVDEELGGIQTLELGASFIPSGTELKVTLGPFLPNFMMDKTTYTSIGIEVLNPAVQLIVEEMGKVIYKGWIFKKFPSMYAFEHHLISIELLEAIPTHVS